MRISDWSSDVCSSDLYRGAVEDAFAGLTQATSDLLGPDLSRPLTISLTSEIGLRWLMPRFHRFRVQHPDIDTAILSTYQLADLQAGEADRKSVVQGKSVSVRVELGGRSIIKKKITQNVR